MSRHQRNGNFLKEGGDDAVEAERVLRALLTSDSEEDRYIAFCFLAEAPLVSTETAAALQAFRSSEDNVPLIKMRERVLRRRAHRTHARVPNNPFTS